MSKKFVNIMCGIYCYTAAKHKLWEGERNRIKTFEYGYGIQVNRISSKKEQTLENTILGREMVKGCVMRRKIILMTILEGIVERERRKK